MSLSLLGGPLHRLGSSIGLVRNSGNTVPLGIALAVVAWSVLAVLALIEQAASQIFSLAVIGGHVRLLLVIPLFFVCETLVDPRIQVFVNQLIRSQAVPLSEQARLRSDVMRIARLRDSPLPEAICLLLVVLMSLAAPALQMALPGITAAYHAGDAPNPAPMTAMWYWSVCMPLFRFLALRWLWRLMLWIWLLWCLSRVRLSLVATHPDGAGGLGYLEVVHAEFSPLVFAISAAAAATFAESIVAGTSALSNVYPNLMLLLLIDAVLFIAPLCILSSKMWQCRVAALQAYGDLASRYVSEFEKKWIPGTSGEEPLLGSPDLQSLADLSSSFDNITRMRLIPAGPRLPLTLGVAALLPLLPLLLFEYPMADLAERLFKMVFTL